MLRWEQLPSSHERVLISISTEIYMIEKCELVAIAMCHVSYKQAHAPMYEFVGLREPIHMSNADKFAAGTNNTTRQTELRDENRRHANIPPGISQFRE